MLNQFLVFIAILRVSLGLVSNITPVNKETSKLAQTSSKSPSDLLFTGFYVCDKYSSQIQSTNSSTDFPIDFDLYVSVNEDAPSDNYTVDLYFKNPNHNSLNGFAVLNASDAVSVLSNYNPVLISTQPDFGVEFKFNFRKGLLCQFLYQFTVAYQLEKKKNTSEKSDKIFLVGSCQMNARYHPEDHQALVSQGYRCVEYNSGFKYDGGLDWCSEFYPASQCCDSYENDELTERDSCPASTSLGPPASTVANSKPTTLTKAIASSA